MRDQYQASHHRVITSNDKFLIRIETLGRATWEMHVGPEGPEGSEGVASKSEEVADQ